MYGSSAFSQSPYSSYAGSGILSVALIEALTATDSVVRRTARHLLDALPLVDTIATQRVLVKVLTDAATLVTSIVRTTARSITEVATIAAGVVKTSSRQLVDVPVIVDTFNSVSVTFRQLIEVVGVLDSLLNAISAKILYETTVLVDSLSSLKIYTRTFAEVVALVDVLAHVFLKFLTEAATISSSIVFATSRLFAEIIAPVDRLVAFTGRLLTEVVATVDSLITAFVEGITARTLAITKNIGMMVTSRKALGQSSFISKTVGKMLLRNAAKQDPSQYKE